MAAAAVLCALVPPSAMARPAPERDGNLSSRLAELTRPALRSAPVAEQAEALSLASGGLAREGRRVLVDVRFDRGALDSLASLRAAGATIVSVSRRYQTITVAAKPGDLRRVGGLPRVAAVTEVFAPILNGADCGGSVRSEGDTQLVVAPARSAFGVDGSGVTVGILSDSFDRDPGAVTHAAGDVATGDLPGPGSPCGSEAPVNVLSDLGSGTDEGRAMAQIVHDLAPGASLSFATAFGSQFGFANNIRALRAAGANVIVDDVFHPDEPFFQDGPIAVAVNEVTASGAAYFSAAGNDNLIEEGTGNEIGSWEAPQYRDSESCPVAIVALSEKIEAEEEGLDEIPQGLNPAHCMDFDPGIGKDDTLGVTVEGITVEEGITVKAGGTLRVDLQWAEPWDGVGADLDAFLLDEAGNLVEEEVEVEKGKFEDVPVGSAEDNVNGSQQPVEYFEWENPNEEEEVQLVVNRFAGGDPRLKVGLIQSDVTAIEHPEPPQEDVVGPTIFGHAGANGAVSVGAIRFNTTASPEPFSSRGPLTHYFGPVRGTTPAAPLGPETISKPDLVATDGGVTTFFSQQDLSGAWRFFGTSAAAPHAAAVAALMKQANPSLSPAQVRGALEATAIPVGPVGAFGPEAVGAGRVNAYDAIASVALPPLISITERPPTLGRERRPSIGFVANRPVTFSCSIDGGGLQPCNSPFLPAAPLADGIHGFAVQGVDAAGRTGISETVSFRIDTKRPNTFFKQKPRKTLRTQRRRAKAVFRFGSNEPGVSFVCKIDGGFWRFCKPRLVRRLRVGKHVVRVKARDAAGNVDRTPAVYRFEVKRAR